MNTQNTTSHKIYQYIVDTFFFRIVGMKCKFKDNILSINSIKALYLGLMSKDEFLEIYEPDKRNNYLTILLITRDKDRLDGNIAKNPIQNFIPGGYKGLPGFVVQLIRWYCIVHKIPLHIDMRDSAKKFWCQVFGNNDLNKSYVHGGDYTILEKLIVLKSLLKSYLLFLYYYFLSKNSSE